MTHIIDLAQPQEALRVLAVRVAHDHALSVAALTVRSRRARLVAARRDFARGAKALGISQATVARYLGLNPSSIHHLVNS